MSEEQRLHDKLDKLRALTGPGQAGPREIHGQNIAQLLRAMLLEIDETILARKLTFGIKGGTDLCLEVANRRLLRVVAPSGYGASDLPPSLQDQDITEDDTALLGDLHGHLVKRLDDAAAITIETAKLDRTSAPAEIGCSAANLAQAFSINLYEPDAGEPSVRLNEFLTECSVLANAWVHVDANGTTEQSQASPDLEKLQELAQADLKPMQVTLDKVLTPPQGLRCVISAVDAAPDMRIVLATEQGSYGVLMVANEHLQDVIALFRQMAD